jgi:hypothetical protein
VQHFKSKERKQRSALALVGGAVIVCFATVKETDPLARGWVIAVDTASWKVAATWCSTARGSGGGIWMSGSGPGIQSNGSIWVVTGNGEFDGQVDWGESVVRLAYSPPSGATPGSLKVTGWWTPWTDDGRTGGNPEGELTAVLARANLKAPLPTASNFRLGPFLARHGIDPMGMASAWGDQDLGAGGIVLIESKGIALVCGKDGVLYTINLSNPGGTTPQNLAPASAPANYAKLAAPPILYTYYDPTVNPATPNPSTLNLYSGNRTHHLHGTALAWSSAAHGQMHFCGGENGNLRAWSLAANNSSTSIPPLTWPAAPRSPPRTRPSPLAACPVGASCSRATDPTTASSGP